MKSINKVILVLIFVTFFAAGSLAGQRPYFEISQSKKRTLAEKALNIWAGDTYSKVISTLGNPTYEQDDYQKQNKEYIGKSLKYYAVIWKENLVNEINDEYVYIVIGKDNKVKSVYIRLKLQ